MIELKEYLDAMKSGERDKEIYLIYYTDTNEYEIITTTLKHTKIEIMFDGFYDHDYEIYLGVYADDYEYGFEDSEWYEPKEVFFSREEAEEEIKRILGE